MHLEMKNIVMDFGPVCAVNDVSITVDPGEIVGLLGENGAGKSTMMNVLAGVYSPTSGKIFIDGKEVEMKGVRTADEHGIRFIHQELNLCNDLRVYENMFLGNEIRKNTVFLDKAEMIRQCGDVFQRMNVSIDPTVTVGTLSAADKQLVEIAKALLFRSELIIMDEPSTALATHEIENLFNIMRQLKIEGVSFIYISHKMPELFEICDIFYVMRDGKLIGHGNFSEINEEQITEMMIGHHLEDKEFDNHVYNATDKVVMKADHLSGGVLQDISFELHEGEILAVTGLQGSGKDDLADILFGVISHEGSLQIDGNEMPKKATVSSVKKYLKTGTSMVPRMRKERGIHNDLSVQDNLSMGYINTRLNKLFINDKEELERFKRQQQAMSIKVGDRRNPITSLSGGNQQKVILGKWLESDAHILIFDNPTQGIDVGTKFEIYHLILNLAKQGKSIIVFSSEFPEIYKVADSCIVLYHGRENIRLDRKNLTEKNVMYYSTGSNLEGIVNG